MRRRLVQGHLASCEVRTCFQRLCFIHPYLIVASVVRVWKSGKCGGHRSGGDDSEIGAGSSRNFSFTELMSHCLIDQLRKGLHQTSLTLQRQCDSNNRRSSQPSRCPASAGAAAEAQTITSSTGPTSPSLTHNTLSILGESTVHSVFTTNLNLAVSCEEGTRYTTARSSRT